MEDPRCSPASSRPRHRPHLQPLGTGQDMRLVIATPWADTQAIPIGASIACSGCCLTAVEVGPGLVRGRRVGRDAVQDQARHMARRQPHQPRTAAAGRRRAGRAYRRRPRRRAWARSCRLTPENGSHALAVPRAGRAGAVHRAEGQRRGGRRVADRQRGPGRHVRRQHHPAHLRRDDARRLAGGRSRCNIEIDTLARYVARLSEYR